MSKFGTEEENKKRESSEKETEKNKEEMASKVSNQKATPSFKEIMALQGHGFDEWPQEQPVQRKEVARVEESKESPVENLDQMDSDYILALQLQEQMDLDAEEEELQDNGRKETPNEKVSVGKKSTETKVRARSDFLEDCLTADDAQEDEEEDYIDEEELEELKYFFPDHERDYVSSTLKQKQHEITSQGGRLPKSDVLITKHDPTLVSIRNADKIGDQYNKGNLGYMEGTKISNRVFNELRNFGKRSENRRVHKQSRDEVQTKESVMDQRTRYKLLPFFLYSFVIFSFQYRLILFRMTNSGILKSINGCISTGKEASVYHSQAEDEELFAEATKAQEEFHKIQVPYFPEFAIKIFKTSLNEFKTRHKYMAQDTRFGEKMTKNPRKFIKLWAEKEMKNLKRISGIPSINAPVPVVLQEHVLIMQFIGENGKHAPQLREATLSSKALQKAYKSVINMMRDLFQIAALVHADLSAYNILYFKKKVYLIDFAAAVSSSSHNALEFLRNDCTNVTNFFSKSGANTLSERELYNFITLAEIDDTEEYISFHLSNPHNVPSDEEEVRNQVFLKSRIPANMSQVKDPFSDYQNLSDKGEKADVFHNLVEPPTKYQN